jgi:flavin reductase (DIM6/NTAB) family NADH-FMN oxidoreductase RutF/rubredoxin
MDQAVMNTISYGLYLLTGKWGEKRNGCIINTAMQVTSNPNRIFISVNKQNYTCEMIQNCGIFNLNMLSEKAPFSLFERFGFASGRDTDKFSGFDAWKSVANTLPVLTKYSCSYLSAVVTSEIDAGTHMLFLADVVDGEMLSSDPAMTYAYYHAHVKPQPEQSTAKSGWRCKICGYVEEAYGDGPLPEDYVCPLCKHGPEDFEKVETTAQPVKEEMEPTANGGWRCKVCGYVEEGYNGQPLPADYSCPVCGVGAEEFESLGGVTVKEQMEPTANGGWRCKICGYVEEGYNGQSLPEDYSCPVCGVGAEDFEPIN